MKKTVKKDPPLITCRIKSFQRRVEAIAKGLEIRKEIVEYKIFCLGLDAAERMYEQLKNDKDFKDKKIEKYELKIVNG